MINSNQQKLQQAVTAHKEGKLEEAESVYREILEIEPTQLDANNNLGVLLYETNRLEEAEKIIKKAIELMPNYAVAHNNLGNTQKSLSKLEEAETSYKKAIELKPNYVQAYNSLGNTLFSLKRFNDAEKNLKKAIELKPDYAEANQNLGVLLYKLHNLVEAEKCYKKAIELKPDYTIAYSNLGVVYFDLYRFKDAEVNYKKALELNPNFAEAYRNLGNLLYALGRIDEALINYNHAYTIDPDMDFLLGDALHSKMHLCKWDDLSKNLNELTKKINNEEKVATPFSLLSLIGEPSIHRKVSEITSNMFPKSDILAKILPYHNHKKIKIGYFSPDFKNHPVAYLTAELYETHDRKKFEIHAFSFGQDTKDEFNIRIKKGVDYFHDVQKMSNLDVVKLARFLEIDITIDLAGYTREARPNIFAMSTAPIQVNYLGYPGTMGVDYMDYLIADHILIPSEKKIHYSEKIVLMPNSYQPNYSKTKSSEKIFKREDFDLPKVGFIFCCFNKYYKITSTTFAGWMRILLKVEGSVIWLTGGNNTAMNNLKKEARKNGIDDNRLIFAEHVPLMEDHLSRIKIADLFLDTLPFNAISIASDALRMGVPILTCKGNSFASRVSASLLNAVNLPEMITSTQDEYESLAIELATNLKKMKKIKEKLVNNLNTAPLFNTLLYTQHLEAAYSKMYERYQNKLDIEDIEIDN